MKIQIDVKPSERKFLIMSTTFATGTTANDEPLKLVVGGNLLVVSIGEGDFRRDYVVTIEDIATRIAELDDQLMRERREEHRDFLLVIDEAAGMIKEFNNRAKEEDNHDLDNE